jgi:predicted CoA-binding protein
MMTRAENFIQLHSWAVVGASKNQEKYGYKITVRLMEAGKEVFPVNPGPGQINGVAFFPDLGSLPKLPDIVDLVVPPAIALNVVDECARVGIKRIWFQPGTRSAAALNRCLELGIEAVDESCVLVELNKLGL